MLQGFATQSFICGGPPPLKHLLPGFDFLVLELGRSSGALLEYINCSVINCSTLSAEQFWVQTQQQSIRHFVVLGLNVYCSSHPSIDLIWSTQTGRSIINPVTEYSSNCCWKKNSSPRAAFMDPQKRRKWGRGHRVIHEDTGKKKKLKRSECGDVDLHGGLPLTQILLIIYWFLAELWRSLRIIYMMSVSFIGRRWIQLYRRGGLRLSPQFYLHCSDEGVSSVNTNKVMISDSRRPLTLTLIWLPVWFVELCSHCEQLHIMF